ncbi:MAG TPA: hypothetical protein VIG99_13045 [Myxococcaceae bacterium]|jgi:Na+-driven multidrug efflux pump
MSRQRRALVSAFFTYCQWALSFGTGLVATRIVLDKLGIGTVGLWTAVSGMLGYAALSDLGVLTVLPWLVANADGRKDEEEIRRLTNSGFALGAVVGAIFAAVAGALWIASPWLLKASPAERELLFVPFVALVALTAIGSPLRAAEGVLQGLQDVKVVGSLTALQPLVNFGLVMSLLYRGQGLLGLALGAALPRLLAGLAFLWRLWRTRPQLFRGWGGVRRDQLNRLLGEGLGPWLGSLGWLMAFSTDAVILASLGFRDEVAVFAVTSRFGLTLMQLSWTLPDAGLVGLSQLWGEAPDRVGETVSVMARVYMLLAGGVVCAVLALNAVFVRVWVGADKHLFGGQPLNAMLAAAVLSLSVVHSVAVPAAVLGNRRRLGVVTALNGVVHIALARLLGAWLGLVGIALATAISGLITTLPVGLTLLPASIGWTRKRFVASALGTWWWRFVPLAALAGAVGWADGHLPQPAVIGLAALVGVAYLLAMRPLLQELPLDSKLRRALQAVRLVAR